LADDAATAEPAPSPAPAETSAAPEPAEPRLPVWMVKPPPSSSNAGTVRAIASGATFSFEEVAASAGLTMDELRDVERFGIVTGRPAGGGITVYDDHAVVAARVAAQFMSFGVEPRHLRLYRVGAAPELLAENLRTQLAQHSSRSPDTPVLWLDSQRILTHTNNGELAVSFWYPLEESLAEHCWQPAAVRSSGPR